MTSSIAVFLRQLGSAGALLVLLAPAHAARDCSVNGQPVNPDNGATTRDKTGLMRCKDRESGVLLREEELRDGKFVGLVRVYKDGKLEREHSRNDNGNLHGRAREFGPDGTVLRDAHYDNGNVVGLARSFHPNGQLKRASFSEGPRDTPAWAEFTPRGQLRDLACADRPLLAPAVDDAKLCGHARPSDLELFRDNGALTARSRYEGGRRLRHETLYEDGKPSQQQELHGNTLVDRSFWPQGGKRRELKSTLDGRVSRKEQEQEFAESGVLLMDRRWSQGEPVSEQTFYLNGQPRGKTLHSLEGQQRMLQISGFHDNGQLAHEGRYLGEGRYLNRSRYQPLPVGVHKRFNPRGQQIAETHHDDRGQVTRERAWDESGKLLRDDEVFPDGSRKAFTR